jgi:hypothetical protein
MDMYNEKDRYDERHSFYYNTNNSKWKTNSVIFVGIIVLIVVIVLI